MDPIMKSRDPVGRRGALSEAARLLKKCLSSVEEDTVLTEPQRTALVRQLRNAMRDMDEAERAKQDQDAQAARVEKRPHALDQERSTTPGSTGTTAKDLYDAAKGRVSRIDNGGCANHLDRLRSRAYRERE